jgi:hypothetical protein
MRVDVHAGCVEPAEERRVCPVLPVDEVERSAEELSVHRLHPLARERAGVYDGLLVDATKARVLGGIIPVARLAPQHATWAESGAELGIFGGLVSISLVCSTTTAAEFGAGSDFLKRWPMKHMF